MEILRYSHPLGSMCMACEHLKRNCNYLPFEDMPDVIERYNITNPDVNSLHIRIVKCTDFKRKEGAWGHV